MTIYQSHLNFEIVAQCSTTRARVSNMTLPHGSTPLPTFMPVATQASLKGLTPDQVKSNDISLILNNTYHLSLRPGTEVLNQAHGVHQFQSWDRNLLSDSGGFQMVSLAKLSQVTEEGVEFENPFIPGDKLMLTPEKSIEIQQSLGTDIMMQLDDVISTVTPDMARVEEAMNRSVRWLDRCIKQHRRPTKALEHRYPQSLFAIIQGGLCPQLRSMCLDEMTTPRRMRDIDGYAIGGLSGGESKDQFWKTVSQCTERLPVHKPRYCMGIGYSEDLVVAVALGVDMADCVFPTRTARFGVALTFNGPLKLKNKSFSEDFRVIDENCICTTCEKGNGLSRSFLHGLIRADTVGAHALTIHNLAYQSQLMREIRTSIINQSFPQFLTRFFQTYYGHSSLYPTWCIDALKSVGVDLLQSNLIKSPILHSW